MAVLQLHNRQSRIAAMQHMHEFRKQSVTVRYVHFDVS
jgi:hypothetical protein